MISYAKQLGILAMPNQALRYLSSVRLCVPQGAEKNVVVVVDDFEFSGGTVPNNKQTGKGLFENEANNDLLELNKSQPVVSVCINPSPRLTLLLFLELASKTHAGEKKNEFKAQTNGGSQRKKSRCNNKNCLDIHT